MSVIVDRSQNDILLLLVHEDKRVELGEPVNLNARV